MGDILYLAHRVPFPPNRGDTIRSAHVLRKLATLAPVHVGCFADQGTSAAGIAELRDLAASDCIVRRRTPLALAGLRSLVAGIPVSLAAFRSSQLARWVHETIARYDIGAIVVFSGQMGQYVPPDFDGRLVVDLCDVDSAKFESYAAGAGLIGLVHAREARLLACEEQRLATRADATVLISEPEADLLRERLDDPGKARIEVIGNGIDTAIFDPALVKPHPDIAARPGPQFIFTGQMDYPPNVEAAIWTARRLMPAIRAAFPDAEFHIVGREPTRAVRALSEAAGVEVWGEVPDMRPFLAAATCVLAPLSLARGVQNKVLEAMAMARPVLLSPGAATGIAARDGQHWLVSELDVAAMAKRLATLLEDSERARVIGAAARQFVLDRYGWSAMLTPLERLVGLRAGAPTASKVRHAA